MKCARRGCNRPGARRRKVLNSVAKTVGPEQTTSKHRTSYVWIVGVSGAGKDNFLRRLAKDPDLRQRFDIRDDFRALDVKREQCAPAALAQVQSEQLVIKWQFPRDVPPLIPDYLAELPALRPDAEHRVIVVRRPYAEIRRDLLRMAPSREKTDDDLADEDRRISKTLDQLPDVYARHMTDEPHASDPDLARARVARRFTAHLQRIILAHENGTAAEDDRRELEDFVCYATALPLVEDGQRWKGKGRLHWAALALWMAGVLADAQTNGAEWAREQVIARERGFARLNLERFAESVRDGSLRAAVDLILDAFPDAPRNLYQDARDLTSDTKRAKRERRL